MTMQRAGRLAFITALRRARAVRWTVCVLVALAVFVGHLHTAVGAVVAGTAVGSSGNAVASVSWSATIASGSNRMLLVRVASLNSGVTVSGVTYGGVALTQLSSAVDRSSTTAARATLYYLLAPAVGTANVVVTMSGSTDVVAGSLDFTGVSQTAPFGSVVAASGNSTAPAVTVAGSSGDMFTDVVAAQGYAGTSISAGSGQTPAYSYTGQTANDIVGMASTKAGAASSTLSWSYGTAAPWVSIGVPIHAVGATVAGTVFEDQDYGGGAGRSLAASSGTGVAGVTVELYNSSGGYLRSTTTAAGGTYSFADVTAGNYTVRAVNGTVVSQRSGSTSALRGVMTYRTDASGGSAAAVTNFVGGTNPALVDPGTASSGATLNTSTGVFSAGLSGTAMSFSAVSVAAADIVNVDFGFNFDTVVNTNNSGTGSLRQAITNANALGGDGSLAQSGATAGTETLLFMISNGTAASGLRSTNNYFSGGVATITPTSALPTVTSPLNIDGSTQPGYGSTPLIDLYGASAGVSHGLQFTGGSSTVKALIARNFSSSGVYLNSNGNSVQGCWLGLNTAGTGGAGNGAAGVYVTGSNNTIGGSTSTTRNVISGNGSGGGTNNAGILIASGTGNTLLGNYVGLNAAGTALVANWPYGIDISSASNTVGGTVAGAGNVSSGHQYDGIILRPGSDGTVVQGNIFGANAANTAALGNSRIGITVQSNNNTIGGTAAGAGNVARGNSGPGVAVVTSVTGNAILGNSIFGNGSIGIDLAYNGQTTNDGATTSGQPNLLMDYPVFTRAVIAGSTLVVSGYVGSAANQSLFAGARVEVFISDVSNTNGQGKTYLGSLTTDASGNFSGSISGVSGVTAASTQITGTATDGSNNTSEFGPNKLVATPTLSGTVFEDVNYGGGAGRDRATAVAAGGAGVGSATVELYSAAGSYVTSTTTAANGSWSFTGQPAASYLVRVLPSTVDSNRSGSTTSLLPVQTYRYEASGVGAAAVTNEVGGARPDVADSIAGVTLAWTQCATESGGSNNPCAFSGTRVVRFGGAAGWYARVATDGIGCSVTNFGDPTPGSGKTCQILTPHLHSVSSVSTVAGADASADFGFNFDTVANANDSGIGSLRQAITNANTLTGDASLAQSGRTAALENLVFMLGNGSSAAGLRSSTNLFTTSAGSYNVATLTAASALPTVSAPLVIDAQTQPGWAANPLIEVNGNGLTSTLFRFSGGNSTLRGFVVNRLGSNSNSAVRLDTAGGNTVQGNWLGPDAAGATATVSSRPSYQMELYSGANTIGGSSASARNVISNAFYNGIVVWAGAGNVIQGNYIGTNAAGSAALSNPDSGIVLPGSSTATGTVIGGTNAGEGNVISGGSSGSATTGGIAIQGTGGTGSVIRGNKIGLNAAGTAAISSAGYGIYTLSANTTVGGTAAGAGNTITGYAQDGVAVVGSSATGVVIQGNSIYGNSGLGIDLADNGITANDGAKTASQPNLLMDFPVFTSATLSGTTLNVAGYVGSAAGQSTFAAARVEVFISDGSSANGQGKTYLGYLTADASGNFSGSISGVAGVVPGNKLTATATDGSGNTSEFGPNASVTLTLSGTVFEDVNYGGGGGRNLAASGGSGIAGARVELYSSSGSYVSSTTTASGGSYSFTGLGGSSYYLRVVSASVLSSRSGASSSLVGVLTFRTDASSGTPVDVTNGVGGTNPALADPGNAAGGAAFNTTTFVYSAGLSGTAHAVSAVTPSAGNMSGLDFGFNFDTVVNTNDSGQGSLRQAITNANTLAGDASLAQSGHTAAIENIVFMLGNGSTAAGLRSAFNVFTTSAGSANAATITLASGLPALSTAMVVDAQTQPGWTAQPLIEVRGNAAGSTDGLTLSGGGTTVRGLVVNRFSGNGVVLSAGNASTLQGCWIGLDAAGSTAAANSGTGVVLSGGSSHQVGGSSSSQRNVISGNGSSGIYASAGGSHVIQGNYISTNAAGTAAVGNAVRPVFIDSGVTSATLGGTAAGAGNVISGTNDYAVWLAGGATTVQGNTIGLNAAGTAALANGYGIFAASGGHQIGGTTAAARNVVAGNTARGIWLNSAGNTVQGNYVGTNAAGTAAFANTDGIYVKGANNVIGGTAAGAGNLVSGNSATGILLHALGSGSTVQGNVVGLNAAGTAALANAIGINTGCTSGCAIGGTAAGAGNTISGNSGNGVQVGVASAGNAILGNSIYGNGGIGIDLDGNGATANDGSKTAGQGNLDMDTPVFTSASLSGSTLSVAGYVGSAAGQSTFASARVEVFISDASNAAGQGKTYLGYLTTDASGNFSGSISGVSGVSTGSSRITATATDTSNNSSEFGPNLVVASLSLSGTVFEDVNYGGGAGRSLAASSGTGLAGATVELYSAGGSYVASTTTAAGGGYSFGGLLANTSYFIRVAGPSVVSSRSGSTASLVGVMTWRSNAASGSAVAVTDWVGGTNPAVADPGAAGSGAAFNTTSYVFSAGLSGTAQAVAPVSVGGSAIAGIDFGFNFDTVVNSNDSGAGSLRQAITNANTLAGDASLAQAGRSAGVENLVFMISNGSTGNGGLRSSLNYFSGGVATIAPTSLLPAVSTSMVIDAQTQPGWATTPLLQLNGNAMGGICLQLSGGSSTLRGFIINRCQDHALDIPGGSAHVVQGNWIGLDSSGSAASAYAGSSSRGISVANVAGVTIGGSTAAQRNVISGNNYAGIYIFNNVTALAIRGNYIGTNAAGSAAVPNAVGGIRFGSGISGTSGVTIGGSSAGQGNVISGNTGIGIRVTVGGPAITGNTIGLNAAASAALPNSSDGIQLLTAGSGAAIGGTTAGSPNTIAGNGGNGVTVLAPVASAAILGNSIYGNSGIGIDLDGNGATANDGAKTAGQGNLDMDYPVFTSASLAGSTLSVAGYVGSAAGQSTFAAARVEIFIADAANTNGQGKTYLGFLTADASGNFSGTLTGVAGITTGSTKLTATATDGSSNTSEFGPNLTVASISLAGTVFEDVNYGGGAGRSLAGSGGSGVAGAVVELYDASGNYVASTTSAAGGSYSFGGVLANTSYFVRVAGPTVASSRSGSSAALVGVLTWRTTAASGSAVAVTDNVGGTNPAVADPGAAASGAAFNTSTFVYTANLSGTAQAVTPVSVGVSAIAGLDFGFNFDTVVNSNDSGAGSLRQAITNANTLGGDSSLAQAGRSAAIENIVFMLPNGTAGSGLRSAFNTFTTSAGSYNVATLTAGAAYPVLTAPLVIDAQTQPGWTLAPLIEINANNLNVNLFTLSGGNSTLRGFVVNRLNTSSGTALRIDTAGSNTVQGNWFGLDAAGATASFNGRQLVQVFSGSNLIGGSSASARNVISKGSSNGIVVWGGSGNTIQGNYIGTNAAGTAALGSGDSGIALPASATNTVIGGVNAGEGNLISGNGGGSAGTGGIAVQNSASTGSVIRGNRIGLNAAGSAAIASGGYGIYVAAASTTVGGTTANAGNTITGYSSHGVAVVGASTSGVTVQGNAVYGNSGIGIDLGNDGVSPNDGAKTSSQPNLLMDAPVISSARARANQLTLAGYVGSAAGQSTFASSRVEFFISDNDASGYGEGKTYLGFLTADANGNFSGTLSTPVATLAIGSKLTATATDGSGNTSEFGANFASLVVDLVVNSNLDEADSSAGDGSCLTASAVCTLRAAIAEINAQPALSPTPLIVFAIPGCSSYGSAGCKLTPATALPSVTRALSIDATTQSGWNASSCAPLIELDGSAAPAATSGLVLAANGSTIRGLVIDRFGANGITVSSSGSLLAGNSIGLNVAGSAAAANGGAGISLTGSGNTVGGSTTCDRNLIAGNSGNGVLVNASSNSILGNAIGTNASGSSGLGNGGSGVQVQSAALTGIAVSANTIVNNASRGVGIAGGGSAQVSILGNSIAGNGALGIDLGNDGVTANTGSLNASLPDGGMNQPVVTGAGVAADGLSVTVYGYVGTGTGQAVFAGARVEIFKAAADSSGYGEGQLYLGALTADASGRFSGTLSIASGSMAVGDPVTGSATLNGNSSEFGANWTTTTVAALLPAGFNAFETSTGASAISGVITSKTAGALANLAVIALDSSGSALHPGFTGSVSLTWVDARDDSGGISGSCRASWVNVGAAGSAGVAVFANASRVTVSVLPPAAGTRVMRLKMSYSGGSGSVTACSNDAFADMPASLAWVNASDADAATAGTARVLSNTSASGGVVHRAGRPFTVRAQALDATGTVMTGYDGSPALSAAGCLLPSGCTAAALGGSSATASAGVYTNNSVTYAEVGALQLQLSDSSYGAIDSADTAAAARTVTSSALSVGRFVPDSLLASVSTNGVLATGYGACMASGQGATFIGQGFGWAATPQVTLTAYNAAGAVTTRWTGTLMKLSAGSGFTPALAVSGAGSASFSATYGGLTLQDLGGGQVRATASGSDRFLLDLPAGSVQASSTPGWGWTLGISDASEAGTSGNPTLSASAAQAGVGFDQGAVFHSGRLALAPAIGDARSGVQALVHLQRWTSAGWVTVTEDRGCITVQRQNLGVESPSGVFTSSGSCAAPLAAAAITTRGGRAWLALPGTPGAAPGRLTLRLAGSAASGNSCSAAGSSATLVAMGLPWLLGGSSGSGPVGIATWGRTNRDAVLRRETW